MISAAFCLLVTTAQLIGLVAIVGASVEITAVIGFVTAGLLAFVAAKINAGRRWARWLWVVIYFIGSFGFAVMVLTAPALFRALPAILQGNMIIQFVLQTAALVLLFTSPSRQWFKYPHAGTAP